MATRVLIVEDEPEFLRRFSDAVLADPRLQLLGAVASGTAAVALLSAQSPDVLLIDLGLPDISGVDVIRHAAATCPQCDVLVVTMFGDDGHVLGSIEAGATGYLLKDASLQRIAASIHELREGGSPISPSIARRVLMKFRLPPVVATGAPGIACDSALASGPQSALAGGPLVDINSASIAGRYSGDAARTVASTLRGGPAADGSPLSERETEILRLVAKGLSFDTVGGLLDISSHTVVAHVKKIYRKLAVHSRGEAVYEAGQMGLL